MAGSDDHYQVLGVDRAASASQIKQAFRRLARRHHPDVNPGDPEAAATFDRIRRANEILSDPRGRAAYDRAGVMPVRPRNGRSTSWVARPRTASLKEAIAELWRRLRPTRGRDLDVQIELPFADAVRGSVASVNVRRQGRCGDCHGAGCPACGGRGAVDRAQSMRVRIPAGVTDGDRVRVAGKGEPGRPDGDLYVATRVRPHPQLRREGRDIRMTLPLAVWEAALGTTVACPTLDGEVTIRIPAGTQGGQMIRLRGRGVPEVDGVAAGDQLVEVQIEVPRADDRRTRALLHELKQLEPDRRRPWHDEPTEED